MSTFVSPETMGIILEGDAVMKLAELASEANARHESLSIIPTKGGFVYVFIGSDAATTL